MNINMPYGNNFHTKRLEFGSPPPPSVHWDPGAYIKIEFSQHPSVAVPSNTYFPSTYTGAAGQSGSVVSQVRDLPWLKGILLEANYGDDGTVPTYNWAFLDKVFSEIKANAPGKKIMILLTQKVIKLEDANRLLPSNMRQSTDADHTNGTVRYDHLWANTTTGYHYNLHFLRDSMIGNARADILRTGLYAWLQELADRYANSATYEDVFAGVMTTESAGITPLDGFVGGNSNTNHFKGRIALLKKLKTIFPNHMVTEDCNVPVDWVDVMTTPGYSDAIGSVAVDGLIAQRIAFTQSNMHTGDNRYGWTNIDVLQGVVPIIAQTQGQDMDSKHGERPTYLDYPDNPLPGWPDSSVTNTQVVLPTTIPAKQLPPDGMWSLNRARHFQATHWIIQHNYSTALVSAALGTYRYSWPQIKADINASAYATDPVCGMNTTKPTYIV